MELREQTHHDARDTEQSDDRDTQEDGGLAGVHGGLAVLLLLGLDRQLLGVLPRVQSVDELLDL